MYSVVLLMAISGGAEAPAGLFHHGSNCSGATACAGCTGSAGCTGAYAGCTGSSCHGGGHRLFGGGCHGGGLFSGFGCHGGSSCHGAASSCHGGSSCHGSRCHGGLFSGGLFHRGHGCHGCSGVAYTGCTGGAGCTGGVVAPTTDKPKDMPKPGDKPKEETSLMAPATIIVSMPADAKLTIDDASTTSMGAVRTFVSPTLNSGREYHYTLRTEIAGKSIAKQITVRAGEETRIELSSADVAQK
jgi:uncharacterized protein (TIGR03000 family)